MPFGRPRKTILTGSLRVQIENEDAPAKIFDYLGMRQRDNPVRVKTGPTLFDGLLAKRSRGNQTNQLLVVLLLAPVCGCIAVKNPVPATPSPSALSQWQTRYSTSVRVRSPALEDFKSVTNTNERERRIQSARLDTRRLAEILSQCRLFKEVVVSDFAIDQNEVLIEALPNAPPYADPDDAWLLLYGGVIPLYDREDVGVRFRFVNGGTSDFVFPWTTHSVIGFWAPFFAAFGPGWRLGLPTSDSAYWNDLRRSLIEAMDRIEAVRR